MGDFYKPSPRNRTHAKNPSFEAFAAMCLMIRWVSLGIILLILPGCATKLDSVTEFESAPLFGMIYDMQNVPVQGVILRIDGDIVAQSDIEGRFLLPSVIKGNHVLSAEKDQYEPITYSFDFLNRTQVLHLSMTSDRNLIQEIENALSKNDTRRAQEKLERLLAIKPGDPEVLFLEAIINYKNGEIDKAKAIISRLKSRGVVTQAVMEFEDRMLELDGQEAQ